MKGVVMSLLVCGTLLGSVRAAAEATCPRTLASSDALVSTLSGSDLWYGSESLAVALPPDGFWPTTAPGAGIAVKTFWRSAAFRLGTESSLKVEIEKLYQNVLVITYGGMIDLLHRLGCGEPLCDFRGGIKAGGYATLSRFEIQWPRVHALAFDVAL